MCQDDDKLCGLRFPSWASASAIIRHFPVWIKERGMRIATPLVSEMDGLYDSCWATWMSLGGESLFDRPEAMRERIMTNEGRLRIQPCLKKANLVAIKINRANGVAGADLSEAESFLRSAIARLDCYQMSCMAINNVVLKPVERGGNYTNEFLASKCKETMENAAVLELWPDPDKTATPWACYIPRGIRIELLKKTGLDPTQAATRADMALHSAKRQRTE